VQQQQMTVGILAAELVFRARQHEANAVEYQQRLLRCRSNRRAEMAAAFLVTSRSPIIDDSIMARTIPATGA
jgi:hypothetical protein